ncbi:tetratricopeptide repeat protein [Streptomyces sp. NPDC001980]|uniref:tetratricopeptide repeat protein n=1 Tax=Streptomyces sp. NPDC001980 TaxID=3157126 RepID=UPI003322B476
MVSDWKGGRPRGPVRAASEEARELAVFLRERVDLSGKTYRQLAQEIYVSRTQISEFLSGKVPHEGFVVALLGATAQDPASRVRDERRALKLLAEARRSLRDTRAAPDPAAAPQPPSPWAPGSDLARLLQRRMELELEVAALKGERKRLKREERHTRELNQVRELLARAEAARDQAAAETRQAMERQQAAERSVAQERDRTQQLTQRLTLLGLSGVVPDNPVVPPDNRDNVAQDGDGGRHRVAEADPHTGPAQPGHERSGHAHRAPSPERATARLFTDAAGPSPVEAHELPEMWAEASAAADAFRITEAVRLYAELVVAQSQHAGADHPDTLTARHNLAAWRGEAGDPAGAVAALAELLTHRERVLGADHADTLATRHNLAHWQGALGNPHAAAAGFAALLPDAIRVLGADHPDTLAVRHALAVWRGEAGDATGAADALDDLLTHRRRVLGSEHPDTLATRSDLAQWRGVSGDVTGAMADFDALLSDAVRLLGRDHMYTLIIRCNLAAWRGVAGDTSAAAAHLSELFPDTLRVLGRRHPHTEVIRNQLAFWKGRSQE